MAPDILDLDIVVRRLAADAKARLAADAAAVWLLGPDGSELALQVALGFKRAATTEALAHRPAGRLPDWLTPRRPPGLTAVSGTTAAGRAWLADEAIRSVIAVPLAAGGVRLGLLAAFRRRRAFTRAGLARARALAAAAAPTIHAAARFAEERERAQRAEMLLAVTQTLASTSDLSAALGDVARRTAAALGAAHCEIELKDGSVPGPSSTAAGAALVVPIGRDYDAIGTLRLVRPEHGEWPPQAVELATAIAGHIALAAENVHLVHQAEAHASELATLRDVATTLTSTLDLPLVLEGIADAALALIGAGRCAVFELDPARQLIVPRVSRGVPIESLLSLEPGQGAVGAAALRRTAFFSPDVREQEPPGYGAARVAGGELVRDAVARQAIRAVLAVPLISKDALVGVISVAWDDPHAYDEREVRLLTALAQQAAIALDNARLYDEAQQTLTDLKAVQQKLVQGETLRALGELAGGAAHHLNNLLTIVVGRVQLLLRAVEDERVRRPLAIIEKAAKDGAEVVRRLQQFSRTRQVGRLRAVSLDDVARDVLGLTRGHWQDDARARGVSIEVESLLGGVPPVEGDAAALREAVTNLVLNAVDAMPAGGRLTVATRAEGDRVALVVTDTGVGMSESVRLKAHEPFFTTKGVKATGLGLSVAYGIVRSHGGELTLDSAAGRGTTIMLTLPRAAAPPPAEPPPPPRRPGALRLLLVDDEREVREALAEMLESHGHTVLTAGGAEEALARLEAEPALDLVLTDLVMPGRNGWDLAAAVKARRPDVAVGLITGWSDPADVDEARQAAVDFVVEKPVSVATLQEAVARVRGR